MTILVYSILIGVCIQIFLLAIAIAQVSTQMPVQVPSWTPESVLITIGCAIITILISIVGWLVKKQLDTILSTMEMFTAKQTSCREDLPGRFADKDGTAQKFKELYDRTDRHEKLLERHSVMIGGRRTEDKEAYEFK